MAWWDSLAVYRKLTVICGAITAVLAAALAIANAMTAGEPYWIATRGYTRQLIGEAIHTMQVNQVSQIKEIQQAEDKIQQQQLKTEVQVLSSRIESIKSKIQDRALLLKQDGPQQFKDIVQGQIEEMQNALRQLTQERDALKEKVRR